MLLLDGAARQLVAEREAVGADLQDALLLGRGQRVEPGAEQPPGEPELDGRGHHGQLLDGDAARRVEPADAGQHRVGDGGRDRHPRRGERLGDVERVAAGQRVQRGGVAAAAGGQPAHGGGGQRRAARAGARVPR